MAFPAESPTVTFENPYKNPYAHDTSHIFDRLERHCSRSSTEYSQYIEKGEWDAEGMSAEKEKDQYERTAKHEQAVKDCLLPFQNVTAPDAIRTLSFHHPGCGRKDLMIKDNGGKTIYYADVSRWTSAPDVVLHTGETKDSPIAAIARFRYSRHLQLGLGDPADELAMVWEEMTNMKRLAHSRYRLEVTTNEPGNLEKRRAIVFQHTNSKEDGVTNRLSCMNFQIVDEETSELLATYLATGWKEWKKRGTMHIRSALLTGNVEILVVLGICGLVEKKWRRDARNSG